MKSSETNKADVVVIGGGGTGLAAAAAAAENGAKVTVLEKRSVLGGNSVRAEGFFAAESSIQKQMGISAPKETLFKMAMSYAHLKINPNLIRAFIDKSSDTVRWLEEKGIKIILVSPYYQDQEIRTWHQPERGGIEVMEKLTEHCQKLHVQFIMNAETKKMLTSNGGKFFELHVIIDGKEMTLKAASIILATGGYGGNKELLKKYSRDYHENMILSGLPNQGDGLRLALDMGAATEGLGILHMSAPRFKGTTKYLGIICQEPNTVWVNTKGERFVDESTAFNHFESINAILQQPGKICYALFDGNVINNIIQIGPLKLRQGVLYGINRIDPDVLYAEINKQIELGTLMKASTWEEIAQWIGSPDVALRSTIVEYNSFCRNSHDDLYYKDKKYLQSLQNPPYYAMKCYTGMTGTIGGIKINEHMEVIDENDCKIPGLYAGGTDVGGWESDTYNVHLSGSTFGFALNSGRIAGENASAYVLKN